MEAIDTPTSSKPNMTEVKSLAQSPMTALFVEALKPLLVDLSSLSDRYLQHLQQGDTESARETFREYLSVKSEVETQWEKMLSGILMTDVSRPISLCAGHKQLFAQLLFPQNAGVSTGATAAQTSLVN